MVSLAGYLRSIAEKGVYDKEDIVQKFVAWEIEVKYMVMCHQKEHGLRTRANMNILHLNVPNGETTFMCAVLKIAFLELNSAVKT